MPYSLYPCSQDSYMWDINQESHAESKQAPEVWLLDHALVKCNLEQHEQDHFMFFFACVFIMASFLDLYVVLSVLFSRSENMYFFIVVSLLYPVNLLCPQSKTLNLLLHHQHYLGYLSQLIFELLHSSLFYRLCSEIFIFLFHLFEHFSYFCEEFYLVYIKVLLFYKFSYDFQTMSNSF